MLPRSFLNTCLIHLHVLVAAGKKMLVGDGLGPEYSQYSPKILGVEGGQFVEVTFRHPLAF